MGERNRVPERPAIGPLLRTFRIAAGLTQEALAERAGLGSRSIQGFESGERRPQRETLQRLIAALDLADSDRARFEAAAQIAPRERGPLRLVGGRTDRPSRQQITAGRSQNVPVPLTSFIGREPELDRLREYLGSARLLTLIGPPGIGKTRLALEAAKGQWDEFVDGIRFIPVAAIREPDLVLSAIAQAIGVEGGERRPLVDQVVEALCDHRCLLILDNFEQVVAAGPLLSQILEACPRLCVLVTSRTRLGVRGEREFAVLPLTLPDVDQIEGSHADAVSLVAQSEAGRLFEERAREARSDFAITRDNARCIAAICRRLDGLPLAIELAAPWVRTLDVSSLLARLTRRLTFLAGGPSDLPTRQRTLRGAIAWSYDLLTEEEQALFRRLAVFSGGFTLPAAEAICEATVETLTSLLDKSLLYRFDAGPAVDDAEPRGEDLRFGMLETIREYGVERLAAHGELAPICGRHLAYFVARAEEAEPQLTGPRMDAWLERLERDHDNFRAGLRWATETDEVAPLGLRLAGALWRFWEIRAHLTEGRRWLELVLRQDHGVAPALRAKGLIAACNGAVDQGDLVLARSLGGEGLALYRHLGDTVGIEWALVTLGDAAVRQGELAAARALYEECTPLARELGDLTIIAYLLAQRGDVARRQGELAAARALCEESLSIRREEGNKWGFTLSLNKLARVAADQGDLGRARAHYEEALAGFRGVRDERGIALALLGLGDIAQAEGDLAAARARYEESLIALREVGVRSELSRLLSSLSDVARRQGDLAVAGALGQEGLAMARELGYQDGCAAALASLGLLAIQAGDLVAARAHLDESLRLYQTIGDTLKVVEAIEAQATLASAQGQTARAVTLWGAAAAWRADHGAPVILEAAKRESQLAAARQVLGKEGMAAAWDAGQGMTLAEAVACATSDEVHDDDSQHPSSACPYGQGERDAEGGGWSDLMGDV